MFGFLFSWFIIQRGPKISCTRTQTLLNLWLPISSAAFSYVGELHDVVVTADLPELRGRGAPVPRGGEDLRGDHWLPRSSVRDRMNVGGGVISFQFSLFSEMLNVLFIQFLWMTGPAGKKPRFWTELLHSWNVFPFKSGLSRPVNNWQLNLFLLKPVIPSAWIGFSLNKFVN